MSNALKLKMALTDERIGVVVVFQPGTTVEEAISAVNNMARVDPENTDLPHAFDPRLGWPTWYIP